MPGYDDRQTAIAKVYSDAILALAERKGQAQELLEELLDLDAYLLGNTDFEAFLVSPMIDAEAREQVLEKVFRGRASDLLVDALQIINRKDRLLLLRAIVETYRLAHQERRGIIDVHVETAIPLTDGLRARLKEAVLRYCDKEAELSESVDPRLLAGLVLKIGDQRIDISMAREVAQFRERLLQRASREIQTRKEAYFSRLES